MELKKENLLCEISKNNDEIENFLKKERMLKEEIKSFANENKRLSSSVEKLKMEKLKISKDLEGTKVMLDYAVETCDERIYTLEKELKGIQGEVMEKSSDKDVEQVDDNMPSTSKCGKCDYTSDDESELKVHQNSNHHPNVDLFECDI